MELLYSTMHIKNTNIQFETIQATLYLLFKFSFRKRENTKKIKLIYNFKIDEKDTNNSHTNSLLMKISVLF